MTHILTIPQIAFIEGCLLTTPGSGPAYPPHTDPQWVGILATHRALWDPPMQQDHRAFPNITRLVQDMVHYNGGTAARNAQGLDPDAWIIERLDPCLGADGVYHRQLAALDTWLGHLKEDEFLTVADGEDTDVGELLAWAPPIAPGECTAREFIDSLYEACI